MKEVSGIEGQGKSFGLEGMRGHKFILQANVRDEKEACIMIGLPDAPMKESKERIVSCLHTLEVDVSMKKITIQLSPVDKVKLNFWGPYPPLIVS